MDYECLFLFSMILCNFLLAWNFALLESRSFWRKKWEEELKKMISLRKYVLSIIYKVKNHPKNVDIDFWDNLKIIDVLEV